MRIADRRALAAFLVASAGLAGGAARADESPARVETVLVHRLSQADHAGVDGSSLRLSPRGVALAWRAEDDKGAYWTVNGRKGKPYATVGALVFSDDGEHHAYFAEREGATLLVVDDRERDLAGARPDPETLRLLPGPRAAFVAQVDDPATPAYAVWLDGKVGPSFPAIRVKSLVFAANGLRGAFVAQTPDGDVVVVDGKPGKPHPADSVGELRWSADGLRLAYVLGRTRVVLDGAEGPAYDRVMSLTFAPQGARFFHVAVRGGRPLIVVDGKEDPELLDVAAPGPVWSPDGRHLAYVAMKRADQKAVRRVVVDGVDQPVFARIGAESLVFSPDGLRLAYWAGNGPKPFYVVDGVPQAEVDQVGTGARAAFSPDSKRFAYAMQRGGRWHVVTDGVVGPPVDGIKVGFPVFTADGSSVVYEADLGGKVHVFVDGKPGPAFDGFAEGGFALGQGSSAVGVIARRGADWRIVVDGVEGTELFGAVYPGSPLVADGPRSFRAWLARGTELVLARATFTPGGAPR